MSSPPEIQPVRKKVTFAPKPSQIDYGGSMGGMFGKMFRTPKTYKTKVYRKRNSILKTNVRALNKEFKSVMKAINKRKYTRRGTEKGYYTKARIAERRELAKMRKEERAMRKLNAPVKQKRKYTKKQKAAIDNQFAALGGEW